MPEAEIIAQSYCDNACWYCVVPVIISQDIIVVRYTVSVNNMLYILIIKMYEKPWDVSRKHSANIHDGIAIFIEIDDKWRAQFFSISSQYVKIKISVHACSIIIFASQNVLHTTDDQFWKFMLGLLCAAVRACFYCEWNGL